MTKGLLTLPDLTIRDFAWRDEVICLNDEKSRKNELKYCIDVKWKVSESPYSGGSGLSIFL